MGWRAESLNSAVGQIRVLAHVYEKELAQWKSFLNAAVP